MSIYLSQWSLKCNNNNNTYCVGHHASLEQPFTFSANMLAGSVDCILEKCFIVDGNKNFVCVARIPNTVELGKYAEYNIFQITFLCIKVVYTHRYPAY